jgi:hypothetical protein
LSHNDMREPIIFNPSAMKEVFSQPETNLTRRAATLFVHVLLFECSGCGGPILTAILSDAKNLECIDALSIALRCPCNCLGNQLGVSAKAHWIEPWEASDGCTHTTA